MFYWTLIIYCYELQVGLVLTAKLGPTLAQIDKRRTKHFHTIPVCFDRNLTDLVCYCKCPVRNLSISARFGHLYTMTL